MLTIALADAVLNANGVHSYMYVYKFMPLEIVALR